LSSRPLRRGGRPAVSVIVSSWRVPVQLEHGRKRNGQTADRQRL